MKLPRKIIIKGATWKIKKQKEVYDDDGNACLGLCNFENKIIYLEKQMDSKKMLEVFFHEFIHALTYEIHLDIGEKAEEMLVESFTQESMKIFDIKCR